MGGQRGQLFRHEAAQGGIGQQRQKDAGRSIGQRLAGGIVNSDAPAVQLGAHLPGQIAVWRDKGRRLPLRLQRPAHDEGDGQSLLLAGGGMQVRKPPRALAEFVRIGPDPLAPLIGDLGRAHGFRQQGETRRPVRGAL